MRRELTDRIIYWLGVGFVFGCFAASAGDCQGNARALHPGQCVGTPPPCDYGMVAVCWCYEDECKWYCTSDGRGK